ncbi:hypothetical protein AAMO2058_000665800 [Amorphochlora amoebiformis]
MSGQSFFEETEEIGLGKDFGRWSTPCPLSTLLNHSVTHQGDNFLMTGHIPTTPLIPPDHLVLPHTDPLDRQRITGQHMRAIFLLIVGFSHALRLAQGLGTEGGGVGNTYGYACIGASKKFKFCDTTLDIESRVSDLVHHVYSRYNSYVGQQLTARESSSIPEITLPAYYWGTNAIHGVQNVDCLSSGRCPTSFPAPCGLGAAFNMSIVEDMAKVIGLELRAYLNSGIHHSLNTWSPTINLNRDPRWGRNVESPSEDPMMNGQYGVAYTKSLQEGEDPHYKQAIVTLKHWIAYSLESYGNYTRHNFDAKVSAYDLEDSYFPAFRASVQKGGALGIMCSYNKLNGKPTCGNKDLTDILRKDWGFKGYITSDTDACMDMYKSHKYVANWTAAAALCLQSGTDIDSGVTYAGNLHNAVGERLVSSADAKAALSNAYRMRMLLGLFDPYIPSPYRNISQDVVGTQSHQDLSLHAARQSMVLLKNEDKVLPFKRGARIAVIGQAANDTLDLLGNYVGPICPDGMFSCFPTIFQEISKQNTNGETQMLDNITAVSEAEDIAKGADYVILIASNARDGGREGMDRVTIGLDNEQSTLCQRVLEVTKANGIPTVLLLINGGALSIDELIPNSPAILEAFSPGVHGSQAIGECLFGDYNPGGKLPVTIFPKDYINQTSKTPSEDVTLARVTVVVTNTGSREGDEVVQVYSMPPNKTYNHPTPIKTLVAYQRVHLEAGERKQIDFELDATAFSLVNKEGSRYLASGFHEVVISRGHGEVERVTVELSGDSITMSNMTKWW